MTEPQWICISVCNKFILKNGIEAIDDLVKRLFSDDYIEHVLFDLEEALSDNLGVYVFVKCTNYQSHGNTLFQNVNITNVLDSYKNIRPIPEEEIFSTRKTAAKIFSDDDYVSNRTGFLMEGDIVTVRYGHLSNLKGVVLREAHEDNYEVFFRLFTTVITEILPIDCLQFNSSIFKHYKFPLKTKSEKHIKRVVKKYKKRLTKTLNKRLLDK